MVKGPWSPLEHAVEHAGPIIDVLLTEPRDTRVVNGARA